MILQMALEQLYGPLFQHLLSFFSESAERKTLVGYPVIFDPEFMQRIVFTNLIALTFLLNHCISQPIPEPIIIEPEVRTVTVPPPDWKPLIGRVEWIEIPAFEFRVEARVDSGARTNSLHAENIVERHENGVTYVDFDIRDDENQERRVSSMVIHEISIVRPIGPPQKRYVIQEEVRIGERSFTVQINLNDRSNLTYRFLVGRNLLMGHYLIDVSQSYIYGD